MVHSFFTLILIILPVLTLASGMAMTPLLILLMLIGVFFARGAMRHWSEGERIAMKYLAPLALWPLVTVLWSISPQHSLMIGLATASTCAIGLAAYHTAPSLAPVNPRTLYYMATHMALVGAVLLLERLLDHGLINEIFGLLHKDYERFMLKNINRGLCALTVFIWPLMLGLMRTRQQRIAWLSYILLGIGILAMHSLSAKIGFIAGLFTFLLFQRWPQCTARAVTWLPVLFLALFVPALYVAEQSFFQLDVVREHLPPSGLHRLAIWNILFQYLDGHWLVGWGMDTARALPMTARELQMLGLTEPPLHPHSPSFQILLEEGLIGFLLTITGIYLLLRQWQRLEPGQEKAVLGATIASYFVSGISSFGIWQSWWIATLFIALFLWNYLRRA